MSTVATKRVFILEPLRSDADVESLSAFGEPKLMFNGVRVPSVFETEEYCNDILQWLKEHDYHPQNDAFVVSGRLTKVAIALAAVVGQTPDKVRVLIYDGAAQKYVERFI